MKKFFLFATLALLALLPAISVPAAPPEDGAARIKRGRYLVERVALCSDCHSQRDWRGRQDREHWLQGATLDFKPARLMPWAAVAPAIAGLPTLTNDAAAVKYFETGINAAGKASAPPMPQFRLEPDDAVAMVAYLRSLKPVAK